ncbi:protein ABIL2 isoform X1 [Lactuca sativa]|uniref:protein ABIL2 isoform X1 n=1 Tax=Lactuca sativa TaxID=4236 RepID=UPI000CD9AD96|nr:protein ABIL2 isoform X1 [Lactuca sativa]
MEAMDGSSLLNDLRPPSNHDEIFMQRSLVFADSLKDLRNIRMQLYSAAEFFEDSYHKSDHDELLLESLKDYVSKALVSTIDHLGSVSSKINSFLDENLNEALETNLQILCIEQRLRTCHTYSDHEGLLQQSLMIQIPKYHKQYRLPDGRFNEAVEAEKAKAEFSSLRRRDTGLASIDFRSGSIAFSFAKAASNKGLAEKRAPSMSPSRFRIKRTGSTTNRSTSPSFPVMRYGSVIHRSISPNTQQSPVEAWSSQSLYPERERRKDMEVYSRKTRNLFKALLSMNKHKNEYK